MKESNGEKKQAKKGKGAGKEDTEELLIKALLTHAEFTVKRIKMLPLPATLKPKHSVVIASEILNDPDISSTPIKLILTVPTLGVDKFMIEETVTSKLSSTSQTNLSSDWSVTDAIMMYLQTCDLEYSLSQSTLQVKIGDDHFTLAKGCHYFASMYDAVQNGSERLKSFFPAFKSS
jgi:hypothetical protein